MDSIQIQRCLLALQGLVLWIKIHFISHLLFDVFENLSIHKLREGIQLFLVKQRHKVIAEPPHFAFSVKKWVL
jgi:hypothetical protein